MHTTARSKHPPILSEQAHTNLITLLLHLNEEDDVVVKACKTSLKKIGPYLGSSGVNSMFQV